MNPTARTCWRTSLSLMVAASLLPVTLHFVKAQGPGGGPPADLTEKVNAALGLQASSVIRLDLASPRDGVVVTHLSLGGQPSTLLLQKQSARAKDYQVLLQEADGSYTSVEPGPVRTYRGRISEIENSAVAATLLDDGLYARIFVGDDEEYWVQPVAGKVHGATPGQYALYRRQDIIPRGEKCGLEALAHPLAPDANLASAESLSVVAACGTGRCVAELACDADYEFFQQWGSVSGVENRINSIINAVNVQYERDVQITHVITTIIVRTAEADPYTYTESSQLLLQFRSQWLLNHSNIRRDLAQLFTGKDLNSNVIGIAWLDGVCNSLGFSVVQSDCCGSFGCATDLSAHEMGHNWGADHCSCTSYTMNAYITCSNRFQPVDTIPEIIAFRDSLSCLDGGATCTSNAQCDDGTFCNGAETCASGVCQDGADPCPGQDCDEAANACIVSSCDNNGTCAVGEDCNNCRNDCPVGSGAVCGNGVCEVGGGEDCVSCSADCNGKQDGKPSGRFCCGDGDGPNPVGCADSRCTAPGYACSNDPVVESCCGDGVCEGSESGFNCEIDCGAPPSCGDGTCDPGEDHCSCPADCGAAPTVETNCGDGQDNDCDGRVDCSDSDCSAAPACSCAPAGTACLVDAECCSNRCRGKGGAKVCK